MLYSIAADIVVIVHLIFVAFVVLGGLLVIKKRKIVYFHIPAVIWGTLIEFFGWICPLTPLEQKLRMLAGQSGYSESFIEHYIIPVLYPDFLARDLQIFLGLFVIIINLVIYCYIFFLGRNQSLRS